MSADPVLTPRSSELVLASASPRRRELLAALRVPFTVVNADLEESPEPGEEPAAMASRLARLKAEAGAERVPDVVVLGADTVVVLQGQALGKPADAGEATAMLRSLRGREHIVITAVRLHDGRTGKGESAVCLTTVTMRDYAEWEIAQTIAAGTPFDKAGAYAIQDSDFAPVSGIDGCYCNVVGLPLWPVRDLLDTVAPAVHTRRPSETRPVCATCPLKSQRDAWRG